MKQTLRIFMVLMVTLFAIPQSYAQRNKEERISREELAKVQAHHIAKELAFDDKVTKKFVDTYCRCQQDIWALGPRVKASSSSDEATEEEIEARFEHSQKILDIRRKYYKEYSKFLTQRQIKRVYEIERQMMNRLAKHKKSLPRKR